MGDLVVVNPVSEKTGNKGPKVSGERKKKSLKPKPTPSEGFLFQQNSICSLHFVHPLEIFKDPMPNKLIDLGEKKSKQSLNMS